MDKETLRKIHPMIGLVFYLFIISTLVASVSSYISVDIGNHINYYVQVIWHGFYGTIVLLLALIAHVVVTARMKD